MCYNYDRENVRGGINMLNYRKIEPADDKSLAELIRTNLEYTILTLRVRCILTRSLTTSADFTTPTRRNVCISQRWTKRET